MPKARLKGDEKHPVILPHDAMQLQERDPEAKSGSGCAYYPGGCYTYEKRWTSTADAASSSLFEKVDVAGYNYAYGRYEMDGQLHPDRVIAGSETFPHCIYRTFYRRALAAVLIGSSGRAKLIAEGNGMHAELILR